MSREVLEKAEVQQLLNELFNFADNSFVQSGDRVQAFKLGRPVPKIGDVDRCAVYISLAPGMENPAGVDPPEDDAARCARYTSSEEEQNDPALTIEDRVAGKRPLAADPSPAEALPAEISQAPKRRRLVRITDDDEDEEAAPSVVQRPRSRPDVAPATTGRVTSDPPAPHAGPTHVVETGAQRGLGRRPDHVAGQRVAEPVAAVGDAAPQTTERPAAATAATSAEEQLAPASATASTPTRNEEAARTPPPRNVVEEESRAPTPPPAEERGVPTPPRAGASLLVGSLGLDQGPMMPATTAGGSTVNEETRAASDDDVEEIQDPFCINNTTELASRLEALAAEALEPKRHAGSFEPTEGTKKVPLNPDNSDGKQQVYMESLGYA
ncbi:uncharacterized protein LOC110435939 [Sorghum bicolor]|uniref:uncharacterized protein LOC110435939 n=1 Tax=Sorghum bicolor TaxID=4558 RepID=UPI000B426040|nr:uncharacterized protein LOC110435939 [Sorghum bicolor]|eukprot:XP_021317721.1 uncharacterized protein LOC110435939 [Sorghum bicolor]